EKDAMDRRFLLWNDFLKGSDSITDEEFQQRWDESRYPDEVAIIMYTSGSTGSPKGVMLTEDMLLRASYATCMSRAIEDGRVTFAPLPFYHCFAIIEAILAMSFVGGSFISALGASPLQSLQLMEKYKANDYL
ncbi:acyl--CoA ligase, partial [Pseudoalteromonas sp. 2103]|nr:acyl--CoA ligase [Pseudoalteromonas sp. 2103]